MACRGCHEILIPCSATTLSSSPFPIVFYFSSCEWVRITPFHSAGSNFLRPPMSVSLSSLSVFSNHLHGHSGTHVSVKRRPAASECALCFIETHWDAISPNFSPECVCMRFESHTNASSCVLWTCWNASQICMRFNAFCSFSEAS